MAKPSDSGSASKPVNAPSVFVKNDMQDQGDNDDISVDSTSTYTDASLNSSINSYAQSSKKLLLGNNAVALPTRTSSMGKINAREAKEAVVASENAIHALNSNSAASREYAGGTVTWSVLSVSYDGLDYAGYIHFLVMANIHSAKRKAWCVLLDG
jgi:hypothetical protein